MTHAPDCSIGPIAPTATRPAAGGLLPTVDQVALHQGCWLASYALPCADGWLAYTKLCWREPEDSWDGTAAFAKVASGPCATARAALERSVLRARQRLEQMATWASGWPDLTMV